MRHLQRAFYGLLITLIVVFSPLPAFAEVIEPASTTDQPAASVQTATPDVVTSSETPVPSTTAIATDNTASAPVTAVTSTQPGTTSAISGTETLSLGNVINSVALSGNATVVNNETAGSATTGSALSTATILNVANANGATAPSFNTFQCDINGDSEGDIVIDPASLLPICTATSVGASAQSAAPTQGLQTGASLVDILNNIVLTATSGDASVNDNETAGSATSGNATTLANILNIANTGITSQRAFLGVINIFGNLKGNILVPQSLVDGLIGTTGTGATNIDTTSITNTISSNAQSGNATVAQNETGGNATTGSAATSVTVLNLTGQQVVAKNSLLVFVNVLGKWVGLIVPAPGSTTTAMLGSDVQGSRDTTEGIDLNHASSDSAINITNNLTLQSQSGNATVSGNETAGDATSGNAATGANILNITDSNFLLDDWFGALFINVLGSWLGNFDIQAALAETSNDTPGSTPDVIQDVQVYQFTKPTVVENTSADVTHQSSNTSNGQVASVQNDDTDKGHVFGMSTTTPQATDNSSPSSRIDLLTLIGLIIALTIIIATSTVGVRRKLRSQT